MSMMDSDALKKGEVYDHLRRSIVIFICTFDPFGNNSAKYTFETLCREDTNLSLNDGMTKIFLNTKGDKQRVTKELAAFLEYVNSGITGDDFTEQLRAEVDKLRTDDGKEELYMTYNQEMMHLALKERNEGKAEGKAEGRAEGKVEEKNKTAQRLLNMGLPIEQIVLATELSKDVILGLSV